MQPRHRNSAHTHASCGRCETAFLPPPPPPRGRRLRREPGRASREAPACGQWQCSRAARRRPRAIALFGKPSLFLLKDNTKNTAASLKKPEIHCRERRPRRGRRSGVHTALVVVHPCVPSPKRRSRDLPGTADRWPRPVAGSCDCEAPRQGPSQGSRAPASGQAGLRGSTSKVERPVPPGPARETAAERDGPHRGYCRRVFRCQG